MNVVIFGKGFGKPRQVNLSGKSAWVVTVLSAVVVSAFGFAGGYWVSTMTGSGVSMTEVGRHT
jgi:predicted phage tail protein